MAVACNVAAALLRHGCSAGEIESPLRSIRAHARLSAWHFPLFFLGLFGLLLTNEPLSKSERWIVSANVVLIPISVWTAVKSGGGLNSLLFAYLAMAAFVISQLERFSRSENFWQTPAHRFRQHFPRSALFTFFSIKIRSQFFSSALATTNTSALLRWQGS